MNKKRIFIYLMAIIVLAIAVALKQKEIKALRNSTPPTFNGLWKKQGKPVITKKIYRRNIPIYEKITLKPKGNIFEGYAPRKISKKLKIGQKIHASFNGRKAKGEITYVSPKISFDTGMNLVKAKFNCKKKCDKWLVTYVKIGEIKNALNIPGHLLIRKKKKTYIWTVKNSIARKKEVILENSNSYGAIIKSGIFSGNEIILQGHTLLSEGDKILRINGELQ